MITVVLLLYKILGWGAVSGDFIMFVMKTGEDLLEMQQPEVEVLCNKGFNVLQVRSLELRALERSRCKCLTV